MNIIEFERLLTRFQNAAFVYGYHLCAGCPTPDDFDIASRDFLQARNDLYSYVRCFND